MSKLRQLVEAARRKCEMAWKVYSYNPEKDNELVNTSKAFDCIAAAQAHKRELLEKNPNYTVEIIAESAQKNEDAIPDIVERNLKDLAKEFNRTYDTYTCKFQQKASYKNQKVEITMSRISKAFPLSRTFIAQYVNDGSSFASTNMIQLLYNGKIIDYGRAFTGNIGAMAANFNRKMKDFNWGPSYELDFSSKDKNTMSKLNIKPMTQDISGKYIILYYLPNKGYGINVASNGKVQWWNLDNKEYSSLEEASNVAKNAYPDRQQYYVGKVGSHFYAESAQKNEATFKPGDKVSVKSYYKDGNQFITLRNATIIKEITEKEAGQLDPAYNWKEPTGMKYYLVKLDTGSKKAVLASDLTLESAQKNEASKKTFTIRRLDSKTLKIKDATGKLHIIELKGYGPSNLEADIEDFVKDKLHGKLLNVDYDHDKGRGTMDIMVESAQKNEDDVIRRGKTINGDPWTETKIKEVTVNILGVNLKYNIVKFHVETPDDKRSFGDKDRIEYQLTNEGDIEKIEKAIQTAIRSKMGNKVTYGSGKYISIDTSGYIN